MLLKAAQWCKIVLNSYFHVLDLISIGVLFKRTAWNSKIRLLRRLSQENHYQTFFLGHPVHNALHWMYVAQIQSESLSMKQCSPQCIYTLKERVLWCRFLKYRCLWLQYFHSSLEGMVHQIFSELLFQSWWTLSMVSSFVCWNVVKYIFTNAPALETIN